MKNPAKEPSKVLLCCWASLGDVWIASLVIPNIRHCWPHAKIGFLCSFSTAHLLQDMQQVDCIHAVPSWLDCTKGKIWNLCSLVRHTIKIYPKYIRELRKAGYDIAIELYPFFPGSMPLLRKANIAKRVAFSSGGYVPWITDPVPFPRPFIYLPMVYPALLQAAMLPKTSVKITYTGAIRRNNTVILHMGSSDERKLWPSLYWHKIGCFLHQKGYNVMITGKGAHEAAFVQEAMLDIIAINKVNQLSFSELIYEIKHAKALISVDSFPIHIAAFFKTPLVGIYLYNCYVELWLPHVVDGSLLIHARCQRQETLYHPNAVYLEEITPVDVESAICQLLGE